MWAHSRAFVKRAILGMKDRRFLGAATDHRSVACRYVLDICDLSRAQVAFRISCRDVDIFFDESRCGAQYHAPRVVKRLPLVGWPWIRSVEEDPERGVRFDFLRSPPGGPRVMTGFFPLRHSLTSRNHPREITHRERNRSTRADGPINVALTATFRSLPDFLVGTLFKRAGVRSAEYKNGRQNQCLTYLVPYLLRSMHLDHRR